MVNHATKNEMAKITGYIWHVMQRLLVIFGMLCTWNVMHTNVQGGEVKEKKAVSC